MTSKLIQEYPNDEQWNVLQKLVGEQEFYMRIFYDERALLFKYLDTKKTFIKIFNSILSHILHIGSLVDNKSNNLPNGFKLSIRLFNTECKIKVEQAEDNDYDCEFLLQKTFLESHYLTIQKFGEEIINEKEKDVKITKSSTDFAFTEYQKEKLKAILGGDLYVDKWYIENTKMFKNLDTKEFDDYFNSSIECIFEVIESEKGKKEKKEKSCWFTFFEDTIRKFNNDCSLFMPITTISSDVYVAQTLVIQKEIIKMSSENIRKYRDRILL